MKLWATAEDLPGLIPPGELWIDQSVDPETRARIVAEHAPLPEEPKRFMLEIPAPQVHLPAQVIHVPPPAPLDIQPLMAVVDELQRFQKEDRESLADCLKSLLKAQQEQTEAIVSLVKAIREQKPAEFPKAEPLRPLIESLSATVEAMSKHHQLATRELILELTKPKVFERDDDGRITGVRHSK